jgi:hypothetical protein
MDAVARGLAVHGSSIVLIGPRSPSSTNGLPALFRQSFPLRLGQFEQSMVARTQNQKPFREVFRTLGVQPVQHRL